MRAFWHTVGRLARHAASVRTNIRNRNTICSAQMNERPYILIFYDNSHDPREFPDAQAIELSEDLFTIFSNRLIMGPPKWLPRSLAVDGIHEIPVLPFVDSENLPTHTLPFDKANGLSIDKSRLINFYVSDRKLTTLVNTPNHYLSRVHRSWGMTSPDFSVWLDSPHFLRVAATWYNRAVGCYFSEKGIPVIPHLRWIDSSDFDHAFAGVVKGSVVAISNNGMWRDPVLRQAFISGLHEIKRQVDPPIVIVYGRHSDLIQLVLGDDVHIIHFPSRQTQEMGVA
ncbi:MAG: DUF4417 domain-containing protein [Microbacteriaceae bacterium]|nr:DUF4417 domain-containing protein [Microbacteriaceae bacterium]